MGIAHRIFGLRREQGVDSQHGSIDTTLQAKFDEIDRQYPSRTDGFEVEMRVVAKGRAAMDYDKQNGTSYWRGSEGECRDLLSKRDRMDLDIYTYMVACKGSPAYDLADDFKDVPEAHHWEMESRMDAMVMAKRERKLPSGSFGDTEVQDDNQFE